MNYELRALLESYNATTVRGMAEAANIPTKEGNKNIVKHQLVDKMAREYFTKKRVENSYTKLSDPDQAVLNRLLLRQGKVSGRSFERELVRAGLVTKAPQSDKRQDSYAYYRSQSYEGNPGRTTSTIFEDILARLTYHGLAFSEGSPDTTGSTAGKLRYTPSTLIFVPDTIRPFLPEPVPVPVSKSDWQPARSQPGETAPFLRDLYLYWDFVRRNEVAILKSGHVGKRTLNTLNAILITPDPDLTNARREDDTPYLYLLRQILVGLNLLEIKHNKLLNTAKSITDIPEFWRWEQAKQLSACLEIWQKVTHDNTLGQYMDRYGARVLYAKKTLLTLLKTLPPEIWIELDDLTEQIREQDIDFLFPDHNAIEVARGSWYYGHGSRYYSGDRQKILTTMESLENKFVTQATTGFLHTLGLVDLGYNAAGAIGAVRLTAIGRAMLDVGQLPPRPAADGGRIIIQPNFQIMAIGPLPLAQFAYLDLFAERRQADRGAFEYHLQRDSVYQAQQYGLTVSEIMNFLTETGHADIPQNVRRSLEEWAAHLERIVFHPNASLLQAADEALLDSLFEQAISGKHLAHTISPTVALIKGKRQAKLVEALLTAGLLPVLSGADPKSANHSVLIDDEGFIRPIHAVPSLHLRGRLDKLAEETDGGWRLTEASLQPVGGSHNKVNAVLEELQQLQRGQLPPTMVARVRSWGNYYGDAAAETLTLIEFQDQIALVELAALPGLKSLLTPFPAGNRALAIVPADKLAEIETILADFGIKINAGLKQ